MCVFGGFEWSQMKYWGWTTAPGSCTRFTRNCPRAQWEPIAPRCRRDPLSPPSLAGHTPFPFSIWIIRPSLQIRKRYSFFLLPQASRCSEIVFPETAMFCSARITVRQVKSEETFLFMVLTLATEISMGQNENHNYTAECEEEGWERKLIFFKKKFQWKQKTDPTVSILLNLHYWPCATSVFKCIQTIYNCMLKTSSIYTLKLKT